MITGWLLGLVVDLVHLMLAGLPTLTLPDWMTQSPAFLQTALSTASQMGHWFPLDAIGFGVTAILACWSFALALRLARIALSLVTGGGGGAA